ncbi:Pkinase-domain-containing protein [Neoconidiobolus thromboides FSU 785]|nr:Pkinase-domain-containing protein [Neoconidiobolus thromboides FSU 785]
MPSSRERSSSSPTKSKRKSKGDNMFGPYVLLYTIGEGEFAKVKYGIHSENGDEAAIKLIRKDNVDGEKLSKIKREISVLKSLSHPYLVNLIEVIETQNYIGIVLEYASGGELFDYILAHRYLKEREACRLFAQLICGVDYIHRNKVIHRDLKLENLLLDRNRNIIVTDFGFANQFGKHGDDLMSTSCGSPCYAAPELVVSDGMYAGSAVDIWSCGVILYAMLAGYLPFDDDPENPEGDNINLLYKYILSTPLSFPDYIGSDARDLLRRMLVPDPLKRCKIKDIMSHRWMAPYKGLFEEFRLQAKVSFATGVPPPLDNDQKPSETITKSRRHTMHIDPSPKMIETHLKKEKGATKAPEIKPLEAIIPPKAANPTKTKSASSKKASGHDITTNTSHASGVSNDPSIIDNFLPLSENNKADNRKSIDGFVSNPLDPFDPSAIVASTQQPLDPFDPNTTVMFSLPKTPHNDSRTHTSKSNTYTPTKTKTRPISMQPQSTGESVTSPTYNYGSVGYNVKTVPLNTGSPVIPKADRTTRPNSLGHNDSTVSTKAEEVKRSNRYDSRKALSAVLDPTNVPNFGSTQRKSTLSPTGTTARRISDWIKRKSIILKGGSVPPFDINDNLNGNDFDEDDAPYLKYNKLRLHRGAVDQFALTTDLPPVIMTEIRRVLKQTGFIIEKDNDYKFKVYRPAKVKTKPNTISNGVKTKKFTFNGLKDLLHRRQKMRQPDSPTTSVNTTESAPETDVVASDELYGDASIDNGEEVRLAIEVCNVRSFPHLFIVDIKRLKGNIWSYKYLYHHILGQAKLEVAVIGNAKTVKKPVAVASG